MVIHKRKRRKRTTAKKTARRRTRRVTHRRKKSNPTRSFSMKRKRRRSHRKTRRHHAKRHTFKRNPFGGRAGGIMDTLLGGAVAGAGGVIVAKGSDLIASAIKKEDPMTKNIIKLALTVAAGIFLPKYVKSTHAKSFVDGMATITMISILDTSFGLKTLAGDDQLDKIIANLNVDGVAEIRGDDELDMLGYSETEELLGVAEVSGVEHFY